MRVDMESLQENLNKARALQEDKPLVISAKKRLPRKNPHHTIHTLLDDNQYAEVSSWQGLRDSQEDFSDIVIFEKVPALSAEELAQIYYDCLIELEYMIEQEPTLNKKQGATYTGTLQFGRSIIAANIGDSASNVITVHDSYYSAIALTWPQNCLDEDEKQRVLLAGGMISDERIGGILAVSRALGDTDYERHGLIHEPEMSHIELEQGTKAFIVNCSDGLTDVMNEGCIADFFAQNGLRKGAENLAKTAIRRGSYDNVTVSLVPVIEAENKLVLSQVIDGHAGDKVAEYANIHLPKLLASKLSNDLTVVKMRSLTQEYAHVNQSPDDYRHNSILTILDSTIHDQRLAIKPEHRKLIIHLQYLRAEVQEQLQAYGKVNDYTQTEEYQLAV